MVVGRALVFYGYGAPSASGVDGRATTYEPEGGYIFNGSAAGPVMFSVLLFSFLLVSLLFFSSPHISFFSSFLFIFLFFPALLYTLVSHNGKSGDSHPCGF